ncbi:MAG: hypothetical protein NTW21_09975 [Verrucomicrobia bacterium]|nr:hypothetical protein [Verrucomicrobiota bacterium]
MHKQLQRATRFIVPVALLVMTGNGTAANNQLLTWNSLGMHRMDP